jgi:hypothetical protein
LNTTYTDDLENFIMDELLPAYIESKTRNGENPNQSYIVKKLLKIMRERRQVPAIFKPTKNLI